MIKKIVSITALNLILKHKFRVKTIEYLSPMIRRVIL